MTPASGARRGAWRDITTPPAGPNPIGHILRQRDWVSENNLDQALNLQNVSGQRLGDVLVSRGWARDEHIALALADQWALGYVDLDQARPDPALANHQDLELYLEYRILPWRRLGRITTYATADPARASEALAGLRDPVGMAFFVVCTPAALDAAIHQQWGDALGLQAATRVPARFSVRSLQIVRAVTGLGLAGLILGMIYAPAIVGIGLGVALFVLNLATSVMRGAALLASRVQSDDGMALPSQTIALAAHRRPPRISILIPLLREAAMIEDIIAAVDGLDYPRELLEVHLLLEASDRDTRSAIEKTALPAWITPIVVPDCAPRTKPKAMNYALDFCTGDIIGILDAEDRPDPSQLHDVVRCLQNAPPEVACAQCQLAYFNADENWITRCFQIEYSIWFDVLLRGFQRLSLPVPLGGTSVYFRRSALRAVGGWDAHNVTEDADLGMRLARFGMRCAILRSTTMEEANAWPLRWIRQRSRWLKGYLLTWLNHMRTPLRLWQELGVRGFLAFNVLFLGAGVSYLAMPLFWYAMVLWATTGRSLWTGILPDALVFPLGVTLLAGQAIMLGCALVALRRRKQTGLLAWVPILPLYWTLGAVAAWKAIVELLAAPYFWDKTRHGLSRWGKRRELAKRH